MRQHHSVEQWHKLPAAVTALILQHVPLKDRLASARVCKTWAEAAALATSSIKRSALSGAKLPGLQSWLQQHGRHLTSLELSVHAARNTVLQLPDLRQLRSLELACCQLQLQSVAHRQRTRSAARSPVVLLPHLTALELGCFVLSTPSTLLQLTRVTTLRSLKLDGIEITAKLQQRPKQLSHALSAVLQCNTQLTQLHVSGLVLEDAALGALSSLQQLQECWVGVCDGRVQGSWRACEGAGSTSANLLSGLPPSLTSLSIDEGRPSFDGTMTHVTLPRQLLQLTRLQQVMLDKARFCPSALASMTQLQQLHLDTCSWVGDAAAGAAAGDQLSQGVAALLAAVGQMLQLESLYVEGLWQGASLNSPDVPVQSYSALTASTCLQRLSLSVADAGPLPLAAVQHMFPAGRLLPQLVYINLQGTDSFGDYMDTPCMTAAELASLISCCPALQILDICNALEASADVSALLQLPPCCTSIQVGGPAFSDAAAGVVCQLSQLQSLTWCHSEGLTDRGLEKLTVLTGLQHLDLWGNKELSKCITNAADLPEDDWDACEREINLKEQDGPPVWQQLRQLCDKSPLCAPARLQKVNRELQQLREEVAALRQHNVNLQEENREVQQLRNKVAALQMLNADLQEENAELQELHAEVAALQQRNVQLEQQVAQLQGQRRGTRRGVRRG